MERFLIPNDSYIDIQKDDVDGKMYITVTVEPKFEPKDGDFLTIYTHHRELKSNKLIGILRGSLVLGEDGFAVHAGIDLADRLCLNRFFGCQIQDIVRPSTEEEKRELLNKLADIGKRWNDDEKCVEDILRPKFQAGDKVRIKDGISSETHRHVGPYFTGPMDKFIGKELTVKWYSSRGWVVFYGDVLEYEFAEDWLEPYTDELKKGDLAIFWNNGSRHYASVRMYGGLFMRDYCDTGGVRWDNAIKFESKEQFERFIKGDL